MVGWGDGEDMIVENDSGGGGGSGGNGDDDGFGVYDVTDDDDGDQL